MGEDYKPSSEDLDDFRQLSINQQHYNRKSYDVVIKEEKRTLTRAQFVFVLQKAASSYVKLHPGYTRRELITHLDDKFHMNAELRRYNDLSEKDFELMLDGAEFPYLDRAWNTLFHPAILEDFKDSAVPVQDPVVSRTPRRWAHHTGTKKTSQQTSSKKSETSSQGRKTTTEKSTVSEHKQHGVRHKGAAVPKEEIATVGIPLRLDKPYVPVKPRPKAHGVVKPENERIFQIPSLDEITRLDFMVDLLSQKTGKFTVKFFNDVLCVQFLTYLRTKYTDTPITLKGLCKEFDQYRIPLGSLDRILDAGNTMANLAAMINKGASFSTPYLTKIANWLGISIDA